jgi:hypothetical protein
MERLKKLAQMTEHPDRYSDEEWKEVFCGETIGKEETDEAWNRFASKHFPAEEEPQQKSMQRKTPLLKIAATFAGILIISGLAFAAIKMSHHDAVEQAPQTARTSPTEQKQTVEEKEEKRAAMRTVTFEDAELQQIADSLSVFYNVTPVFLQQQMRHLRLYYEWDQRSNISEVVSEINHFDHINITLQGDSIIIK